MKTALDYKTPDEVLNDRELDGPTMAHTRGVLIQEVRRRIEGEGQPALKVSATPEQRHNLKAIADTLTAADAEWTHLDIGEKKFRDLLPDAVANLRMLESKTEPDAAPDKLLALLVEQKRLEIMHTFIGNIQPSRAGINQRIIAAFGALNSMLGKLEIADRYYLGGTRPDSIKPALVTIAKILAKP